MRYDERHVRIRGTTVGVEEAALELRKNQTPAEKVLWQALRNKQLCGMKFRRQHAVARYILDFYCPACKLAIEVDGASHLQQQEYDELRSNHLESYGYLVLRFRNEDVLTNLPMVLETVRQAITNRVDTAH